MGFVVDNVKQSLGMETSKEKAMKAQMANLQSAINAPNESNSYKAMDAAQQRIAASLAGGKTSTMLSGGSGFEEDATKTSKVLLGQ